MNTTLYVYKNTDFHGMTYDLSATPNMPDLKSFGLNDSISSLTVTGPGTWFLYQDTNYGGQKWSVTAHGGLNGTGAYSNPTFWSGKNDSPRTWLEGKMWIKASTT